MTNERLDRVHLIDELTILVGSELLRATDKFPPFASPHEGYAILAEELDELWAEVKNDKRPTPERTSAMRAEALQVAAMAVRFLLDITPRV